MKLPLPLAAVAALVLLLLPPGVRAQDAADAAALRPTAGEIAAQPANLAGGLRQLSAAARKSVALQPESKARAAVVQAHRRVTVPRAQADADGRVVVDVRMDGAEAAESVRAGLAALGGEVFHETPAAAGRPGVLSAWLPPERAAEVARARGVHSAALVHRPWRRVGRATSQGVDVVRSAAVNARGFTGRGITVGVLSDSFNLTQPPVTTDIRNDDLPGVGNLAGRTRPVAVLQEGDRNDPSNADEGRALLQIIHDVAPDAALAFSTVGATQGTFADAVRALRTDSRALCDVLMDDVAFPDEPFFSDGVIAQAVDDVVTRADLPGRPVIFYSAAGNEGDLAYDADFIAVPDAEARAGRGRGNLRLEQVPAELTAGGFHNFKAADKGRGAGIAQSLTVGLDTAELDFQWNDAFGPGRATTDYNLLVFDADGNYLPDLSGTDDAFATGNPFEIIDLDAGANGADRVYQLAITRRAGGSGQANHFRYVANTGGNLTSKYLRPGTPTIFGHTGARNADAIGAYFYAFLDAPEPYTSFGPVTVFFDANGNRLPAPEVRAQPTLAGPDGVNTSFFPAGAGNDADGDGFPNFFGTSAAAPHAAGVAALLLQAAGGPGSLNAGQMRDLLTATAAAHDLDPLASSGRLLSGDGAAGLTLSAAGDDSSNSVFDENFFTLRYDSGPDGSSLRTFSIDLGPANEQFDASADNGFPFTIGQALGVDRAGVSAAISNVDGAPTANTKLTLTFAPGAFPPGGTLTFGIDRDTSAGSGGNGADLLAGAALKAKIFNPGAPKTKVGGTLQNNFGTGYSPDVGYGLINAEAALNRLGR